MARLCLLSLVFIYLISISHAAIYLSSTGSDANPGTSSATPVQSVGQAVQLANTVDTIYVMNTYQLSQNIIGVAKNLTFTSYAGWSELQMQSILIDAIPNGYAIKFSGFLLKQLTAATSAPMLIVQGGSTVQLDNCALSAQPSWGELMINSSRLVATNITMDGSACPSTARQGCITCSGFSSSVSVSQSLFTRVTGSRIFWIEGATVNFDQNRVTNGQARTFAGPCMSLTVSQSGFDTITDRVGVLSLADNYYQNEYRAVPSNITVTSSWFSNFIRPTLQLNIPFKFDLPVLSLTVTDSLFYNIPSHAFDFVASGSTDIRFLRNNFTLVARASDRIYFDPVIKAYASLKNLTIDSCIFDRCGVQKENGGAIGTTAQNVRIHNSTFTFNRAKIGGAVFLSGVSSVSVTSSTFTANGAESWGGAISFTGTKPAASALSITISGSNFISNYAAAIALPPTSPRGDESAGGALHIQGILAQVSISGCFFENNRAKTDYPRALGGAIRILPQPSLGPISISTSSFVQNNAGGNRVSYGGAVFIDGDRFDALVKSCDFRQNFVRASLNAQWGGGICAMGNFEDVSAAKMVVEDCTFDSNAGSAGGSIAVQQVAFTMLNTTVNGTIIDENPAVLVARNDLSGKIDESELYLSKVTFTSPVAAQYAAQRDFSERAITCGARGDLPQSQANFACIACTFDGMGNVWSDSAFPYKGHVEILGGPIFLRSRPVYPPPSTCAVSCINSGGEVNTFRPDVIQVSNSLQSIFVTFDFDAKSGLLDTVVPGSCVGLLQPSTLQQSGWNSQDSTCIFEQPDMLVIRSSALPWPCTISFVSYSIMRNNLYGVDDLGRTALSPTAPPLSSAVISAPTELKSCENLFVSSSGSDIQGVFPKYYNWSVVASQSDGIPAAVLTAIQAQATLPTIFILDELWGQSSVNRTLTLSLTVRHSFESPSEPPAVATIVRLPNAAPKVFIEGPSRRRQFAYLEMQLNARVELPQCASSTTADYTVSRSWTLVQGTLTAALRRVFETGRNSALSFYVPAGAMFPGEEYVFRFSASVSGAIGLTGSLDVRVSTLFSPMLVYSTGDSGWVPGGSNLTFEATIVDFDNSASKTLYLWDIDCTVSDAEVSTLEQVADYALTRTGCAGCPRFILGTEFQQTFPAYNLTSQNYTVSAYASRDERFGFVHFRTEVLNQTDPLPAIRLLPRWFGPKPVSFDKITIVATVDGSRRLNTTRHSVRWSLFEEGDDTTNLLQPSMLSTPLESWSLELAFKPDTLTPGQTYTLQLDLFEASTGTLVGRNWLSVPVNGAPSGGRFDVSPKTLNQSDFISLSCSGWRDPDGPLRYSYSILLSPTDEIILSDFVDVAELNFKMLFAGSFVLRAKVTDILGTSTVVDVPIQVIASTSTPQSVIDQVSALNDYLALGDLRSSAALITLLLSDANAGSRPEPQLRSDIAKALVAYANQTTMTSKNVIFLLRTLEALAAVPAGLSDPITRITVVDIISEIANFTYENSFVGFSSSRLLSLRTKEGKESLERLSGAISSVLSLMRNSTDFVLPEAYARKTVVAFQRTVEIMSRISLPLEFPSQSTSTHIDTISLTRCPNGTLEIGNNGTTASVIFIPSEEILLRGCDNDISYAFDATFWRDGVFPYPILYIPKNGNSSVVSTAPVVTVGSPEGANVSVIFYNIQTPIGAPEDGPIACERFDPTLRVWSIVGCERRPGPEANSFTCDCAPSSSAAGYGRTSIALTFGSYAISDFNSPDTPAAPGTSSGDAVGGLSSIAVAAIAAVCVIVGVAAAAAIGVTVYRKHTLNAERSRVAQRLAAAGSGNNVSNSVELSPSASH